MMAMTSVTEERLQRALEQIDGAEVRVLNERPPFMVEVVSKAFCELDEGERQARVWGRLIDAFDDDELVAIEFVFTNTPEEQAQLDEARSSRPAP